MNILVWNSLTISQGDVFFFNNAFSKTLINQCNALAEEGHTVDVIITEQTSKFRKNIEASVNQIYFSNKEIFHLIGTFASIEKELYVAQNTELIKKISHNLSKKLKKNYDAILLWETPAPFLKYLYPNAIILNQMPGPFCKAPYPHMITVDLDGLYKQGTLYQEHLNIFNYKNGSTLFNDFKNKTLDIYTKLNPFEKQLNYLKDNFNNSSFPLENLTLNQSLHGVDAL